MTNELNKKDVYKSLIETIDENERKKSENDYKKFEKVGNNIEKTKEKIDDLLQKIDAQFTKNSYGSLNFAGWSSNTEKEGSDPNVFDDSIYHISNRRPRIKFEVKAKAKAKAKAKPDDEKVEVIKSRVTIKDVDIENLEGLIKLINDYPRDENVEYNINMTALYKIKSSLIELNNMIGMKDLKENIVDQVLYYIQDLHKINNTHSGDFMHTVIYGPPGTGKTEVAKIIGKIFSKLGILKKGIFKKVTRGDLVAGYLGQTAAKTRDVINECLGGCLFIDEAYALGNSEKRDSFSKECIDTLCEALSDHKDELMVIIAGYERELNECFFAYNQGLDSRFTWRFKTEKYKAEDLYAIFLKKIGDCKWAINEKDSKIGNSCEMVKWFEKNVDYFKFYGRDIETLLSKVKIAHSRRIFCKSNDEKAKITFKDLEKGLQLYLKNEEVKNRKENMDRAGYLQQTMYV